jgi:hypothetical protein
LRYWLCCSDEQWTIRTTGLRLSWGGEEEAEADAKVRCINSVRRYDLQPLHNSNTLSSRLGWVLCRSKESRHRMDLSKSLWLLTAAMSISPMAYEAEGRGQSSKGPIRI